LVTARLVAVLMARLGHWKIRRNLIPWFLWPIQSWQNRKRLVPPGESNPCPDGSAEAKNSICSNQVRAISTHNAVLIDVKQLVQCSTCEEMCAWSNSVIEFRDILRLGEWRRLLSSSSQRDIRSLATTKRWMLQKRGPHLSCTLDFPYLSERGTDREVVFWTLDNRFGRPITCALQAVCVIPLAWLDFSKNRRFLFSSFYIHGGTCISIS